MKLRNTLAIVFLAIGSLQMTGYAVNSRILRGIGLASGISPFTKVFCAADGYEAFAASFRIEGDAPDGTVWGRELTPEWYSQLRGPYNRRNVYGAALAFAPRLGENLRREMMGKCLREESSLRQELHIPAELKNLRVIITPRVGEKNGPWTYSSSAS